MSTATKVTTGQDVVAALMTAGTSAQKAKAKKLQSEYVARRVSEGKNPKKVLAGLRLESQPVAEREEGEAGRRFQEGREDRPRGQAEEEVIAS